MQGRNVKKKIILVLFVFFDVSCETQWVQDLFRQIIKRKTVLCEKSRFKKKAISLVRSAESDPNMVTRLFKEFTSYPCLLISNKDIDRSVVGQLFPSAIVCAVSSNMGQEFEQKAMDDFVSAQKEYCVVLTNVGSDALSLPKASQKEGFAGVCVLPVDDILAASSGFTPHVMNVEKIFRLMKRRIHVIGTAAIIPTLYEQRKKQYTRAINRIVEFGYHPYIVESCVRGPTFLDGLSKNTLYSKTNNASLKNKGVNEFKSLLYAFNEWPFDDDDIIVKLTGRYFFQMDTLIRFLEDADDVDCAAKFLTVPITGVDAVLTGCFAMRFGLFKEMLEFFDYDELESGMVCVEHVVGPYLNNLSKKGYNVMRRQKLDVEANMFYTHGSNEISYW